MGKNLGKIIFLNAVGLTIFFSWIYLLNMVFGLHWIKAFSITLMNSFNLKALLLILSV